MLSLFTRCSVLPCTQSLTSSPLSSLFTQTRGVKRVRQKRRSMGRLIQLEQSHYFPKPEGYQPIPKAVMGSGYIRRLLKAGTATAQSLIPQVDWEKFMCDVKGVRWHPCGAWRVQFTRRNREHNFFVNMDCYFYTKQYGFHEAKQLAIGYRKRLEAEWAEAEEGWQKIDAERDAQRRAALSEKQLLADLESQQKRISAPEVDTT